MGATVRIVDEHFGTGTPVRSAPITLWLASERVTVREVIARRVEAEVEELNRVKQAHVDGHARTRSFLVQADATEVALNPGLPRGRRVKLFDAEAEVARAVAAYQQNAFIMLFDDRQIDDPDLEVAVTPESEVVFLYLTPLKGG